MRRLPAAAAGGRGAADRSAGGRPGTPTGGAGGRRRDAVPAATAVPLQRHAAGRGGPRLLGPDPGHDLLGPLPVARGEAKND